MPEQDVRPDEPPEDEAVEKPISGTTDAQAVRRTRHDTSDPPETREAGPPWGYPQSGLAIAALRALMSIQTDRALFRRWSGGPQRETDVPYRATVFWSPTSKAKALVPFLRCRLGGTEHACMSGVSFAKGEGLVGKSWQKLSEAERIGGYVARENLRSLDDLKGDLAAWRRQWTADQISDENLNTLEARDHAYLRRVRSIASIGVKTPYGDLVFCIDSTRQGAFGPDQLTESAAEKPFERRLREILCREVVGHKDFWTWLKEARLGRVGAALSVGSLLSFVPNLIKFFAEGKSSLPAFHNLIESNLLSLAFTFGCLVPFVMVLLSLLPNEDEVSSSARPDVRQRLSRFTAYWARAWMLSIAGLGCMAVATWHGSGPMPETLHTALFVLAMLLKTAAAYSVLATFFCIARFSRDPGPSPSYSIPSHCTAVFVLLAIAIGVLVGQGDETTGQAGRAINSAISGVALCLLVGRLDSHLIGVPGAIMALLYLNAVAHAVCGFATDNVSAGILIARLPLDVLLMAVVAWAIQGRALERYLTYVAEVSGLVPRDTRR